MSDLDALKEKDEKEAKEGYAPTWKPEEDGDQLAGTLKTISMTNTTNGDAYVLTITDEDDKDHALWLGRVLLGKFLDTAPPTGSLVVVTYRGEGKSKAGYTYKNFSMACETEGAFEEWGAASTAFHQKKRLLEEQATGGGGIPQDGLDAPF